MSVSSMVHLTVIECRAPRPGESFGSAIAPSEDKSLPEAVAHRARHAHLPLIDGPWRLSIRHHATDQSRPTPDLVPDILTGLALAEVADPDYCTSVTRARTESVKGARLIEVWILTGDATIDP